MLYIIATPIGNLDDFTPRAVEILGRVNVLACEDTRRTRQLISHFNIARPPEVVSYREQTERRAAPGLVERLEAGDDVALCTDGGYPGISDPGYRLVSLAAERRLPMTVLPGASAVPVALLLSGLPTSSYTFKGYPPRKKGPATHFFEAEREAAHTLVLFESPYRVGPTLAVAFEVLGDRRAAVCRELTKKFEEVTRGYLGELVERFRDSKLKGEVAIVIAGNHPKFLRDPDAGT
jgi:16S rRNA (cytidine1402-2'-O)-methyltransferase